MSNATPIIFLDIDGVICTRKGAGWTRFGKPIYKSRIRRPVRAIDGNTVASLNRLCIQSGAAVVITSMWRLDRDVPAILRTVGFTGTIHESWRTDADGPTRGDEIRRWLEANGNPVHVVIDDKASELADFRERLVLTDNYSGLSRLDVDRAIHLLIPRQTDQAMRSAPA
jgi:hypothetical protein